MNRNLEGTQWSAFEELKIEFQALKEEISKMERKRVRFKSPYLHDVQSPTSHTAKLNPAENDRSKLGCPHVNRAI